MIKYSLSCYNSEVDGVHREPPVTPIGRDELALKRHRFFAELLSAAQAAAEHKVRFNPLGPEFTITDNFGNFLPCSIFVYLLCLSCVCINMNCRIQTLKASLCSTQRKIFL